jgi:hypothetical protein
MKNFLQNLGTFLLVLAFMGIFYILLHLAPVWDQMIIESRNQ